MTPERLEEIRQEHENTPPYEQGWSHIDALLAHADALEVRAEKAEAYAIHLQRLIEDLASGQPFRTAPEDSPHIYTVALRARDRMERTAGRAPFSECVRSTTPTPHPSQTRRRGR